MSSVTRRDAIKLLATAAVISTGSEALGSENSLGLEININDHPDFVKMDQDIDEWQVTIFEPPGTRTNLPVVLMLGGKASDLFDAGISARCNAIAPKCLLASFDLPCHGGLKPTGLDGWAVHCDGDPKGPFRGSPSDNVRPKGSHWFADLIASRYQRTMEKLREKYGGSLNLDKVGLYGVSRGGFAALHLANYRFQNAVNPTTIRFVSALSPMIELRGMREFEYAYSDELNYLPQLVYSRTKRRQLKNTLSYVNGASLFNYDKPYSNEPKVNLSVHIGKKDIRVCDQKTYQLVEEILRERRPDNTASDQSPPMLGETLGFAQLGLLMQVYDPTVTALGDYHDLPAEAYLTAAKHMVDALTR